MLARNRVPTIFNIYMLDVICCALGCVVLLWQVSHQRAEQESEAAAAARQDAEREGEAARVARAQYERASRDVRTVSSEIARLQALLTAGQLKYEALSATLTQIEEERDDARKLATVRRQEYDTTRASLEMSESALKKLRADLTGLQETLRQAGADLSTQTRANTELKDQVAQAEEKIRTLEKDVGAGRAASAEAVKKLQEQLARLATAEGKNKQLEQQIGDLRSEGRDALTRLNLTDLRIKLLEQELERNKKELQDSGQRFKDLLASHGELSKQLAAGAQVVGEAKATVTALEAEKDKLLARAQQLQTASEQRFAGIALTGQSVLFLIDMSGSMQMLDGTTEEPDKWPEVCETIARLMRSMPGLKRFQVILFSDRIRYLFGHDGQWLKFEGETTIKSTRDALRATRPQGETNMYGALAEAFRFREMGLDTMYVLSDGLPNAGEGVPAGLGQLPESQRTAYLARRVREKLKTDWNRPITDQPRVRINTIGFFFESPDVGAFLWALAREHNGSFVGMSRP